MRAFKTMLKTELRLSFRGIDMLIFAICMPVVMTIIIGVLYGAKPAYTGAEYTFLEQSFGAISTIAICAGGVMGLPLLVSDYRQKKILKRFKVTPASPSLILFVQLIIYSLYSIISLVLVYIVSKLLFNLTLNGSFIYFMGSYFLVMISMFSIGMAVGGLSPDSKTAGVIASVLYFPMIVFSGSTLPYEVMPSSMQKIVDVLPLAQGIKLLKATSLGLPIESVSTPIIIMVLISAFCIAVSIKFFKWE